MADKKSDQDLPDVATQERQAYRMLPTADRLVSNLALFGAAVAFGIGTESFAIGIGTLCALWHVTSQLTIEMGRHRRIQR